MILTDESTKYENHDVEYQYSCTYLPNSQVSLFEQLGTHICTSQRQEECLIISGMYVDLGLSQAYQPLQGRLWYHHIRGILSNRIKIYAA